MSASTTSRSSRAFRRKTICVILRKAICNIDYIHIPDLAPTAGILDPYKKGKQTDWDLYQQQFLELMHARKIERTLSPDLLDGGCLLCSEESPHHCHRRLVADICEIGGRTWKSCISTRLRRFSGPQSIS